MAEFEASIAEECVRQGFYFGVEPHYLLAVAKVRSGISSGDDGERKGPFRLTQAQWDANSKDDGFDIHFTPAQISSPLRQCAVFALMTNRAFNEFVKSNNRNPNTKELYSLEFPGADTSGLQKALDDTAALIGPAAAILDDPPSVHTLANPDQPTSPNPNQPTSRAGMKPVIQRLLDANLQRAQNMQINADRIPEADRVARRLVAPAAKQQYQAISATTLVPWFAIAVIHEREASQDFSKNIGQGDPWNRVSTHEPRGRGPFNSFEEAAVDALTNCPPFAARWKDWTFGGAVTLLEQYNGLGYAHRNLPSPYIWAATNQYVSGKFVADHDFRPDVVDRQLGCAALLVRMKLADSTIVI
jgi:lysozyme family protein